MFAYIAHAEADQKAADDLKAFLKSRGMVVDTETGARGFKHLQASDVVIALWSQKSVFANYRLQIERRMFEAWEGGRLVLVKLDHGVLPVGLRDLPSIDAGFESNRQLAVWPQVERAAKEAMNRALVERQKAEDGIGRLNSIQGDMKEAMRGGGAPQAPASPSRPPARKTDGGGRLIVLLLMLALFAAAAWAGWTVGTAPEAATTLHWSVLGGSAFLMLLLFVLSWRSLAGRTRSFAGGARSKAAAAAPIAPGEPTPTAVFISYSHADDAAVGPVVQVVEANGRTVWIDKTGIHTGDGWAGEIVRAIKGAKGMMVMCSKHAFESDHIKREVYLADKYKKPMAPVFLEEAKPPEDFEYFFASVQWLELWKLPEAERPAAIGRALASV